MWVEIYAVGGIAIGQIAGTGHLRDVLEKRQIPYEIQIYPNAGHGFTGEDWRDAGLRSLAFLQKYLVA